MLTNKLLLGFSKAASNSFTLHCTRRLSSMQISLENILSPPADGATAAMLNKAYVNGQWVSAKDNGVFEVKNPANGNLLGKVPDMGPDDTLQAIEAAQKAFQSWRNTTAKERAAVLRKWYNLVVENQQELGALLTAENGKPLAEGVGEIGYAAGFLDWFSEEARRTYGETIPTFAASKRILTIKQPIGVVGMITPWNFPSAMLTRKAGPAIAAGCTVVLKPAEDTPYSALALCELAEKAGVPPGVLNVVTCSRDHAADVGRVLCEHPEVAKMSFTGSTDVGKQLLRQSAGTVKKVSLELGGLAPFLVFDSANVDHAVQGAMASKFRCSGQTCVCANRFYVQEGIHDKFVEGVVAAVSSLKCGDGAAPSITQGPLINNRAVDKVESIVNDAVQKGAKVLAGGKRHSLGGQFFEPTVLTDVTLDMRCIQEEIFGPVIAIMKFKTEDEALAMANDCRYGLMGYAFTGDIAQSWRVSEKLEVGMVAINDGVISCHEAPFGGVKESGLGREGSKYGMEEFMELKYIAFGNIN